MRHSCSFLVVLSEDRSVDRKIYDVDGDNDDDDDALFANSLCCNSRDDIDRADDNTEVEQCVQD